MTGIALVGVGGGVIGKLILSIASLWTNRSSKPCSLSELQRPHCRPGSDTGMEAQTSESEQHSHCCSCEGNSAAARAECLEQMWPQWSHIFQSPQRCYRACKVTEPHKTCLLSSRLLLLNSLREKKKNQHKNPAFSSVSASLCLGETFVTTQLDSWQCVPFQSLCSCSESPVRAEYHLGTTTSASPAPRGAEPDLPGAHGPLKSPA